PRRRWATTARLQQAVDSRDNQPNSLTSYCISTIVRPMSERTDTDRDGSAAPIRKARGGGEASGAGPGPAIYNRLPGLRVERGISRQQLAEALGVNYQTIGYLERGEYNPSLELAFRICEFFGLPIDAVFSRQPFTPMSAELYGPARATRE